MKKLTYRESTSTSHLTCSLLGGNNNHVTANCENPQMRKAQLPGNVVSQTAQTHRADVGRCRQRRRADVGTDVGPISAKKRPTFTRHCRYRPDRMLAQRLDVGNVGSMSEADIGPTCIPDIAFVLNY
jgi:hypothetical protein